MVFVNKSPIKVVQGKKKLLESSQARKICSNGYLAGKTLAVWLHRLTTYELSWPAARVTLNLACSLATSKPASERVVRLVKLSAGRIHHAAEAMCRRRRRRRFAVGPGGIFQSLP